MDIKDIKNKAEKEIESAKNEEELKAIFKKHLGKKSRIAQLLSSLKNLSSEQKKETGQEINQVKNILISVYQKKEKELRTEPEKSDKRGRLDVTRPGRKIVSGHLHPLTKIRREAEEIFSKLGFDVIEGPEIETEYYNFDALNIPKDHPARDMWDTFWLRQNEIKSPAFAKATAGKQKSKIENINEKLLLRTHTSPVQIRYMEKHNPPFRMIVPGRVFRYEATDASHEINFYQLEGLMVDKDISAANFKAIMDKFLEMFFKKPVKIRLRPTFFPFTEPSFEVDINCSVCQGRGCRVCANKGWLELSGAGMVHPNVFKAVQLNPKDWHGFAFGLGLDRLAMMKYKIDDMRLFYGGDLRFLEQF